MKKEKVLQSLSKKTFTYNNNMHFLVSSKNNNSNSLKVVTDSSGGTSPYVFSPCSELSPDVHDTRVLPALTPLELPNFDITNFVKNNANHANSGN